MTTDIEHGSLATRLARVRSRIDEACARAGRTPADVRLIAVSKFHGPERVREVHRAGQRAFGENYAQELALKSDALADLTDVEWHVIGHLQRNKARQVAERAAMVHTVDSARLALALDRASAEVGRTLSVLVQVNVAREVGKSGCAPEELPAILEVVARSPALSLRGLMTIPPASDDPEAARPFFDALASLRDRHGGSRALPELSMGMTQDLECAIASGATMVRVGTAIFGERAPALIV